MGEGGGYISSQDMVVVIVCICVCGGEGGGLFSKSIFLKAPNFPKDLLIDNERQRLEY